MKIDLHVHSSDRSPCGRANDDEQIQAAINVGLDAIVFTDHHRFVPLRQLDILNRKYAPFRIFSGIEIWCQSEDFLVLGVYDNALESNSWTYPDLYQFVHQQNGFLVLAHPFRYHGIAVDCDCFPPDAVEVCSANTPSLERPRIQALAKKWNAYLLCNSDAHSTERLGSYFNILDETPKDEAALIKILKCGHFRCHNGCYS